MTSRKSRRLVPSAAAAFLVLLVGGVRRVDASSVPEPSAFRAAFEAQFPKSPPSAAALALEELAAKLGLSLAPRKLSEDGTPENVPLEKGRAEPGPEDLADQRDRGGQAGSYLAAATAGTREPVPEPPAALARYLDEHADVLDSVQAVLLGGSEVSWEIDVSEKQHGPFPNVLPIMRLERTLLARALVEARSGLPTEALATVDACWRLNEALSSRPELVSQIVAVAGARSVAGVLRRIDAPAFGWPDRLRNGSVLAGVVAAFENQIWQIDSEASDLTGEAGVVGRMYRAVGEAFLARSRCGWTERTIQEIVEGAVEAEADGASRTIFSMSIPNVMDMLMRAARFEIDAELTALVLEARIEREALRRRHWPDRLPTVGTRICSEEPWSYKALKDGTVRIAFEGAPPEDSAPTHLPLEFVAGTPLRSRHHRRVSRRPLRHESVRAGAMTGEPAGHDGPRKPASGAAVPH